jgi:KDO2-lipid IV(A) lauroyltransferase
MRLTAALPLAVGLRIHEFLGTLGYWLAPRRRAIVLCNIGICFPEMPARDRHRLAGRHFAAFGAAFAECAYAWFAPDSRLGGHVEVFGREHLAAALARGHGVILYTGHFTGLEIGGRFLKDLVPDFACMFSRRSNALFDEIQRRGRRRCAHESIPSDNVRTMLERLERNAVVWYAPDQVDTSGRGVPIPFFGEPAMTSTAASRIARVSGATILPFGYRRVAGTARYELEFLAPLEDLPNDDPVADTRRLVAVLEQFVREAPDQYQWTHKRFKARPGVPDPYARGEAAHQGLPQPTPVLRRARPSEGASA